MCPYRQPLGEVEFRFTDIMEEYAKTHWALITDSVCVYSGI